MWFRHEKLFRGISLSQTQRRGSIEHHVNAIKDNDIWQVVKQEKLQEGDFEGESLISFSSLHWCRSTPREEHRPTSAYEHQPTHHVMHWSTPFIESVGSCETLRIMIMKSSQFDTLIHPNCTVWPRKISISNTNQSLIDSNSQVIIDKSSPAPIDNNLTPT